MFLLGGVGMGGIGGEWGSPEVGEMGGGGIDGFCWVLLSRMGKVGIPYGSSASGILAARRLTVTSLSQLPWLVGHSAKYNLNKNLTIPPPPISPTSYRIPCLMWQSLVYQGGRG